MMKFIMMGSFMLLMLLYSQMLMFFYNVCFLLSFMMIFMYMMKFNGMMMGISLWWGWDNYSFFLLLLTTWIIGLMFMSLDGSMSMSKSQMLMFIVMMSILMMFFLSLNLILFYLLFEIILIPTFFLLVYWGSNMERLSAAFYLILYMLVFSLPLLYYIFMILNKAGSLDMMMLMNFLELGKVSLWGYIVILSVFLVKLPIYLFHVWLPKAHVEAPVYGSMVLAAILLKLGGYGLLRVTGFTLSLGVLYNFMIFSVGIIGSLIVSILCLIQIDMKNLVAYSSVVHMNLMLASLMTLFKLGFSGAYIMMISHGLCSSGLFYMVNLYYSWSSSRLLFLNKGLIQFFPMMSFWWFLLCAANFSFPFSLNFISEIWMIGAILQWDNMMLLYLMIISFLSSCYSLYLFSYVQHGDFLGYNKFMMVGFIKEFLVVMFHLLPLLFILLNLVMFM